MGDNIDAMYVFEVVGVFSLSGNKVYGLGMTPWSTSLVYLNQLAEEIGIEIKIVHLQGTSPEKCSVEQRKRLLLSQGDKITLNGHEGFRGLTEGQLTLDCKLARL